MIYQSIYISIYISIHICVCMFRRCRVNLFIFVVLYDQRYFKWWGRITGQTLLIMCNICFMNINISISLIKSNSVFKLVSFKTSFGCIATSNEYEFERSVTHKRKTERKSIIIIDDKYNKKITTTMIITTSATYIQWESK